MGDTAAGVGNLEVSVSFGRFENDLLSWERWSSFSQNKYLEEVEKCSTPGSVAEKKAYFEAHYKNIAAKKAEVEDQQKQFEATLSLATKTSGRSTNIKNIETDNEHKQSEADSLVEEKPICESQASDMKNKCKQLKLDLIPENYSGAYPNQSSQNGTADLQSSDSQTDDILLAEESVILNNESGSVIVVENASDGYTGEILQTPISAGEKHVSNFRSDSSETVDGFAEELEHEAHFKDFPKLVDAPTEPKLGAVEVLKLSTEEMTKLKAHRLTKVPLTTTERMASKVKKAPLSVTPKSPCISSSTTKRIMPTSTLSMMAISRSSLGKGSTSSLSIKKLAPRTHTSQIPGLGRDATVTAPQKSRSKVTDKDNVKRAFKSLQHNLNATTSPGEQRDSLQDQNAKETKVKETLTSHKGKEWLNITVANSASVAQKTAPLLANARTDAVTRKGKEMKVSINPNATAAGSHVLAKSREVKETAVKDLQQRRRFKATPLPAFYRGTGVAKSLMRKEDPKSQSADKHSDKRS